MSLYTGIIMLTELLISHLRKLGDAWKEMGCAIHSPFMTMAYISLACIPELRLTNRGLVDCRTFRSVNAFIKEET